MHSEPSNWHTMQGMYSHDESTGAKSFTYLGIFGGWIGILGDGKVGKGGRVDEKNMHFRINCMKMLCAPFLPHRWRRVKVVSTHTHTGSVFTAMVT